MLDSAFLVVLGGVQTFQFWILRFWRFLGGSIFLEFDFLLEPEPSELDFETEPLEPEPDDFETVRNRTELELPA